MFISRVVHLLKEFMAKVLDIHRRYIKDSSYEVRFYGFK